MRLLFLAIPAALTAVACKVREQPPITAAWHTDFEAGLGDDFYATGDGYHVERGALSARGAHNHPLWLRKRLPRDVRIDVDVWSTEPRGDIKIELFGDGHSFDPDGGRYTATGYEVIFGGWYNQKSIIARLDEHGSDVVQRTEPKVIANQRYHWRIERKGSAITWYVDGRGLSPAGSAAQGQRGSIDGRGLSPAGSAAEGQRGSIDGRGLPPAGSAAEGQRGSIDDLAVPFLRYEDPRPLEGTGHEYLAINNWETDTWFDNLTVTPL